MGTKKLSTEIFNAASDNIAKLAAIFPAVVKDGEVDFAALREELGRFEEVGAEKYEFTWAGKQAAKKLSQTDISGRTLKYIPEDSKNADTTQNLYIEGDNLEVLKLLRQNYYGAVKMIYIDPPYNTGNDFVYRDKFTMSSSESDEAEGETVNGERMVINQKSCNRYHANWLNMMYPRLRIAKDLLRDDGVIFISIDDNEVENLKKLCNEIWGENNFFACVSWHKNYSSANDAKKFSNVLDYIVIYQKSESFIRNLLPRTKKQDSLYKYDSNDGKGCWRPDNLSVKTYSVNYDYPIVNPNTGVSYDPPRGRCWMTNSDTIQEWIDETRVFFGQDGNGAPQLKRYLSEVQQGIVPTTYWSYDECGHNDLARKEIKTLFEKPPFDTPKPTILIKQVLTISTFLDAKDIVLDFFSGSATTAHAVMQLNTEDHGNRRFILVQYPEICEEKSEAVKAGYVNICEIGKERIRRAGDKIKAEIESANAQLKPGEEPKQVPDIGFRVFRVADTNIRWTHEALKGGQIKLDEAMLSQKDTLDFMPDFNDIDVVYEILLRQRDIPLSAKIDKLKVGKRTYMFADAYIVCLDESVNAELVEALAAVEPTPIKYVFRDSAFDDNISLKDETIRRLEAYIARNSGEQKKAYTVEFI